MRVRVHREHVEFDRNGERIRNDEGTVAGWNVDGVVRVETNQLQRLRIGWRWLAKVEAHGRIDAFALAGRRQVDLKHEIAPADAILVLCSHDERVAERAAQLFHEGWAPLVIFSGGQGSITRTLWSEPEAERFARIVINLGVPRESILIESQSTNTGENIEFTKRLLDERGLELQKFILVQNRKAFSHATTAASKR